MSARSQQKQQCDDTVPTGRGDRPGNQSLGWQDHEHVSPPVQVQAEQLLSNPGEEQAQQLVDEAGSKGLAQFAVERAAAAKMTPCADRDAFARQWGFSSYVELYEAATVLPDEGGVTWRIASIPGGRWLVWNESDLNADLAFTTFEEAREYVLDSCRR